ncbi:MAG: hypothetical protein ACKOW9_01680 [Candidatus Paceibacterota bacterium]
MIKILIFLFLLIAFFLLFLMRIKKRRKKYIFKGSPLKIFKFDGNPIIRPNNLNENEWETMGTFNPAVFKDKNDIVHILYRSIGQDGISRLGYTNDKNNNFSETRLSYPVFELKNLRKIEENYMRFDTVLYPSGGSWGGCEDPRLTELEDKLYLTFNAFDGWDFLRIGICSIKTKDFIKQKWNWSNIKLISPKNEVHKNWILFPEKINGKFAIIHSISPEIMIEYRDSLEDIGTKTPFIKSPTGARRHKRENSWDYIVRGAGAPPLKTKWGWLLIYHAIEKNEPEKYKIGLVLLDLKDPTKIIARSPEPLIKPDEWYENEGKTGIVYCCGAIIKNNILYIYYGGGDTYTCVAHSNIKDIMSWLVKENNY